jgi:hypothetical protein
MHQVPVLALQLTFRAMNPKEMPRHRPGESRIDNHLEHPVPLIGAGRFRFVSSREGQTVARVLFLHGWNSKPGGIKPSYLAEHGHTVINPALADEDFAESVRIAQLEIIPFQEGVESESRPLAVDLA